MTRGEAGSHLNAIMKAIDTMQSTFRDPDFHGNPKVHDRLDAIRDQVVLLALDLRLPVQPAKEKSDGEADGRPG